MDFKKNNMLLSTIFGYAFMPKKMVENISSKKKKKKEKKRHLLGETMGCSDDVAFVQQSATAGVRYIVSGTVEADGNSPGPGVTRGLFSMHYASVDQTWDDRRFSTFYFYKDFKISLLRELFMYQFIFYKIIHFILKLSFLNIDLFLGLIIKITE